MNPTNRFDRAPHEAFNLAVALGARQRRRTLVGLLMIAALTFVALLIFFMDPLLAALRKDAELVALFDTAPKVVPGAAVWVAGRPVGVVSAVEFLPVPSTDQGPRVALILTVPERDLPQIRSDAGVRITSEGLISDPVVDIIPGSSNAPPIEAGDTLIAEHRLTAADVMARSAELRAAVDSLLLAARPLSASARERMAALARVQAGFAGTQRELDVLSATLAASPAIGLVDDAAVSRALARLRTAGTEISTLSGEETGVARVRQAFTPLARHAAELSAHLDSLRRASTPNGTLARLQSDSALAVAIRGAQAQLDSLIAEARADPLRYVFP